MDGGDTKQPLRLQTTPLKKGVCNICNITYTSTVYIYIICIYVPPWWKGLLSKSVQTNHQINLLTNHHLRNSPSFWLGGSHYFDGQAGQNACQASPSKLGFRWRRCFLWCQPPLTQDGQWQWRSISKANSTGGSTVYPRSWVEKWVFFWRVVHNFLELMHTERSKKTQFFGSQKPSESVINKSFSFFLDKHHQPDVLVVIYPEDPFFPWYIYLLIYRYLPINTNHFMDRKIYKFFHGSHPCLKGGTWIGTWGVFLEPTWMSQEVSKWLVNGL